MTVYNVTKVLESHLWSCALSPDDYPDCSLRPNINFHFTFWFISR